MKEFILLLAVGGCVTFVIQTPPIIKILMKDKIYLNPEKLKLDCEAEGNPTPKYKWIRNGEDFMQGTNGTLIIESPNKTLHTGLYQCLAFNDLGTAFSNVVHVKQKEPIRFLQNVDEPTIITAEEGKPFILTCANTTGYAVPNINWMLQDQDGQLQSIDSPKITVTPNGNLLFTNVTLNDTSQNTLYACIANTPVINDLMIGNRVFLKVNATRAIPKNDVIEILYSSPQNQIAFNGSTFNLWCIFRGTSIRRIEWSKVNGTLPMDRVVYKNYNKTLKIQSVTNDDDGTYVCEAITGVDAESVKVFMRVTVFEDPYFVKEPESKVVSEGETVDISCEATGNPQPKITWTYNGKILQGQEQVNLLRLKAITKEHTGNYACNASNEYNYVYKDIFITVVNIPPIINPLDHHKIITTIGNDVKFKCNASGIPHPSITWTKGYDGAVIKTKGKYKVGKDGVLEIKDVWFNDAAEYICTARNKFGNVSVTGILVVKDRTKIITELKNVEVAVGRNALLNCDIFQDPTSNFTLNWLKNGKNFDHKSQNNSLLIGNVTRFDQGEYTCVATTDYDNATTIANLTVVDVPEQPEILTVECAVDSAVLTWKSMGDNGSPITFYTLEQNDSFTPDVWKFAHANMSGVKDGDSVRVELSTWAKYSFRVTAYNKHGPSIPSQIHPTVCETERKLPYKNPKNVTGKGTTPSNLVISWKSVPQIDHNAPGFKYIVEVMQIAIFFTNWNSYEITDWRVNKYTVVNLSTYTPFKIRVSAANELGKSPIPAMEVIGYSGMSKPIHSPKNFSVVATSIGAISAIFSWDPVSPLSVNGYFEGYKIQSWTDADGDDEVNDAVIIPTTTSTQLVTYDKLLPYSKNYVTVRAFNTEYDGPSSTIIEVMTGESTPGPVRNIQALPLGTNALYIKWEKPEKPNGILTGYKISIDEMTEMKRITDPEKTYTKIADLIEGSQYYIHVKATTSKGAGQDNVITTKTRTPSSPIKINKPIFTYTLIPSDQKLVDVTVKWIPNWDTSEGTTPGSHFFVQIKNLDEDTEFKSMLPELNSLTSTVKALQPGKNYTIRIVIVDRDEQRISDPMTFHTISAYSTSFESFKPLTLLILLLLLAMLVLSSLIVAFYNNYHSASYTLPHNHEQISSN